MKKKVIDTAGIITICIIIFVFNLIVGANEKDLRILPICIIMGMVLIYLISRKIILKQKIVMKNKIDILVFLFVCSTLLPYIFKTYCTFQGTVEFILKYFFVYSTYLAVRNTIDNKNKINILIAVTIISSLVVAFLGLDIKHTQYFAGIIETLDLQYSQSYVLTSTFGYANTVAIYFSFCIFLAVNRIQNSNKKVEKILYILYLMFALYIIIQTVSRSVFVLFIVALLTYFCLYYWKNILQYKKVLKKLILILAIIFGAILFLCMLGTKISKPYEFTDSIYQRYLNYNFEPKQNYTITIEMDIENTLDNYIKDVEFEIIEMNPYFNEKILAAKQVDYNDKNVTLNFTTTENLYQIELLVLNSYNDKIAIKKCYINGKEYPFNYKLLPYQIGKALTTYSSKDQSIKQRVDFWKDCIKIAKDHPIVGQGGNTWKKLSQAVQEYPYGMKESHSYFFELLISYGIIGVIAYLLLIIFVNIKVIKECMTNKDKLKIKLSMLFGLNLIIFHSLFFDFDMSFLVIMLVNFIYIAALMYDSEQEIQKFKALDYIVLIFFSFILGIFIMANISKYCISNKKLRKSIGFYNAIYQYDYICYCLDNNTDFKYNLKQIQKLMKKEPYFYQNELYEFYWDLLLNNLNDLNEVELIRYLEFINNQYKVVKFATPMYIDTILDRVNLMEKAYTSLKSMNYENQDVKKQINELKKIIKAEYEVNMVNIKDKQRNGAPQAKIKSIIKKYNEIMEKINI